MVTSTAELEAGLRQAGALLERRQAAAADALCATLQRRFPRSAPVRLLRARARQLAGDYRSMLGLAREAATLAPGSADAGRVLVEALMLNGQVAAARDRLARWRHSAGNDPRLLQQLGELHTYLNEHAAALDCHRRALALAPDDPGALYNLATAQIANGGLAEAEAALDRLIARRPEDFDAWYNRATLRRQSAARNHVAELQAMLRTAAGRERGAVALNYALAKELEDLGDYPRAWQALEAGARARRRRLSYDVGGDERTLAAIRNTFSHDWLAAVPPAAAGTGRGALFVAGLPRSGTTLVDRILSSHPEVASLGEINDLALAVTRVAGPGGGRDGLVARTAGIAPASLGAAYLDATRGYGASAPWRIDKTPLNLLYFGLIHAALPGAVLVHVRRHPADSCLAMLKTLFRMGYPFSYDLDDLARYYLAYHALMAHWRRVLPEGRMLEIDYETLVADQEGQTRRLLEHVGLDWHDACLDFHTNPAPTATASAAQVREPVHGRAVGRWHHYAEGLAPLLRRLAEGGIDVAQ